MRCVVVLVLTSCLLLSDRARAEAPPEFGRDVKALLEKHCFECHGPQAQEGGLRLDVKQAVLRGGESNEPAVVPGNSAKSRLIKLVTSDDPKQRMPYEG